MSCISLVVVCLLSFLYYLCHVFLYFILKQSNGLLLGLGFSIHALIKNEHTPETLSHPDATSMCETGRLCRPPPRSGGNPVSATGKLVQSIDLSLSKIGLPIAVGD
jgi:hypothetical protein